MHKKIIIKTILILKDESSNFNVMYILRIRRISKLTLIKEKKNYFLSVYSTGEPALKKPYDLKKKCSIFLL